MIAAALLSAAVSLFLFGCNRGGSPAGRVAPRPGGTLRILHEAPRTLDPIFVDDAYEAAIVNQVYEGLVRLDQNLGIQPVLAESWVVSEDGRLYRFTLRPGVRFHDGRPVTPAAVVGSITRALDPRKASPCLAESYLLRIDGAEDFQAGRARSVRGIRARGDSEVEIRLKEPLSFFLAVLCMDQLKIVPPLAPGESPDRSPVGTGPFRLASRSEDGTVRLARNDDYWGSDALVDSLCFLAATGVSAEAKMTRLLRREVDVMPISASQRSLVDGVAGFRVLRSPDISCAFLGLNTRLSPFDRLEVRQAFTMAIDRTRLIPPDATELEVAAGILPPRLAGYRPDPKVLPFDPSRARKLLAEAGYTEAHPLPVIDFYTNSSSTHHLENELVRQAGALGIRVRTHLLSWPQLDERITRGEAPLFSLSWIADVPDPDAFLWFLFRSGESNNLFGFSDAEVDSLLGEGRRLPPGPERLDVYRRVEARVLSLAPMIPLYNGASLYAWNPAVRGIEVNPFGFAQTRFERVWFSPPDGQLASRSVP